MRRLEPSSVNLQSLREVLVLALCIMGLLIIVRHLPLQERDETLLQCRDSLGQLRSDRIRRKVLLVGSSAMHRKPLTIMLEEYFADSADDATSREPTLAEQVRASALGGRWRDPRDPGAGTGN